LLIRPASGRLCVLKKGHLSPVGMRDYHDTVRQLAKGAGAGSTGVLDLLHDASLAGSPRRRSRAACASATLELALSTAGQGTHAQHPGGLLQPGNENGEVELFVGGFLQNARGGELNAVVAAQGKGVGILTGEFHQ
jgi:hypothetical protein